MNNRSFLLYDDDQEEKLNTLPKCSVCKEPIQEEEFVKVDYEIFCPECEKVNLHSLWNDTIRREYLVKASEVIPHYEFPM